MSYEGDLKEVKAIRDNIKEHAYSKHANGTNEMRELREDIAGARRHAFSAMNEAHEDSKRASEHIRRQHMTYNGIYKPMTVVHTGVRAELKKYEDEIRASMRSLIKK